MIKETVILLIPSEDYSKHVLSKYIATYMGFGYPFNLYYYEPLKELFSRVIVYDYVKRMTEIGVKTVNREIIDLVRKEHPRYVIWVSVFYEFLESTSDIIRKEGTKVVGIFFDDEWRFEEYSKWWIPHLDYCVTSAIEAVPKYRELGARVIHTIPCNGIPINRDWSNIEEKYQVSFVGSKVADREQWINQLKKASIPLNLFGLGWNQWVSFEEMIDIFKTSKINLNFSRTHYGDKAGWKGRILQVSLAGGFLLTEYTPGIERYFEIDKEIVCFHNPQEMIDKIIYYLNHDEERRAIARAGWEKAMQEYTPYHMMRRVFTEIENDLAAQAKPESLPPHGVRMPMEMRKRFSEYYFKWGVALLEENCNRLWQEALALAIRYYPFNERVWYYYIIGALPHSIRPPVRRLSRALYSALASIPYLSKIKQSLTRRFLP